MTAGLPGKEGRAPTWRAALLGLCPVCGAPTLFSGPIAFTQRCSNCGADFSEQNVGDGPAAFLTMIIGTLVMVLALAVEAYITPPFWVHIILWVPFVVVAVLAGLRGAKGWLFHAEWQRRAGEGKVDND